MKKWKILVTPKEAGDALRHMPTRLLDGIELVPTYGRLNDPKQLIDSLRDKEAVVLDLEPITRDVLNQCPRLKVISRFGEGCDAIDLQSVKRSGVRVTKTTAVSSQAVARHTISLILALMHRITENDRNLKNGRWVRIPNLSEEDCTVGIIGFGKVGRAVADLAKAVGFPKVIIYNRTKEQNGYDYAKNLDALIGSSTIISLHVPLTSETKGMISKDILKHMNGRYLINTARGGIVDEDALLDSLTRNEISGYATDVFSREPLSGISEQIARNPNVISSPHVAALDKRTAMKMTERAIENAVYSLNDEHGKVVSYVI